jgi:predicted nucleotidyltransferase
MPGISKEILKAGFRVEETKDYKVVRFGSRARKGR